MRKCEHCGKEYEYIQNGVTMVTTGAPLGAKVCTCNTTLSRLERAEARVSELEVQVEELSQRLLDANMRNLREVLRALPELDAAYKESPALKKLIDKLNAEHDAKVEAMIEEEECNECPKSREIYKRRVKGATEC